jgi:glycine cleavage system H protein
MVEYIFPSDLKYTKTHEWVEMNDNSATIGITDYAQHQLGDIVFVEFPTVGDTIDHNEIAGEIESIKAIGDLNMPLTGEVTAINEEIEDKPELVNEAPYGEGWLIKCTILNSDEIAELLSVDEYKRLVKKEE